MADSTWWTRRGCLRCAALIGGLVGLESVAAEKDTVRVPEDYDTIQAAVDAAPEGGRVEVGPGTYHEAVHIGKPLTIVGDPGGSEAGAGSEAPILDGDGKTHAAGFSLYRDGRRPDDVTIRGFEIRNFGGADAWGHGITDGGGNERITVEDCYLHDLGAAGVSVTATGDQSFRDWMVERVRIERTNFGVRLDHVSDAVVRDCVIRDPAQHGESPIGVYIHADARGGESVTQERIRIEENRFGGSLLTGVYLLAINTNDPDAKTHAELRDAVVSENEFHDMAEGRAIFADVNPGDGARTRLADLTVRENTIRNANIGIGVGSGANEGMGQVYISENDVQVHGDGLLLRANPGEGGDAPAIESITSQDNTFAESRSGIRLIGHGGETANRYVVGELVSERDTFENVGNGLLVTTNSPHFLETITIRDSSIEANGDAVFIRAGGEQAIGSTLIESSNVVSHENGVVIDVNGPDAMSEISVRDTDVETVSGTGLEIRSRDEGTLEQIHLDNNEITAGRHGIALFGHGPDTIETVDVYDQQVDAEAVGLLIEGQSASDAARGIEDVFLTEVTADGGEVGIVVRGRTPDAIGSVEIDDCRTTGNAGLNVGGSGAGAVRDVTVTEYSADVKRLGILVGDLDNALQTGDAAAIETMSIENATVTASDSTAVVFNGEHQPAIGKLSATDLSVDAPAGLGVQIHAQASDAIDTLDIDGLDVNASSVAINVRGFESNAVGSLSFSDATVTSDAGLAVGVWAEATDAIDQISVNRLEANSQEEPSMLVESQAEGGIGVIQLAEIELHDQWLGMLWAGTTEGALESVRIVDSEIRENDYGIVVAGEQSGDAFTIRETNFSDNQRDGEWPGFAVLNVGPTGIIDARENYWGHPSGPATPRPGADPRDNVPERLRDHLDEHYPVDAEFRGQGDRVSDGVNTDNHSTHPL